MLQLFRPRFEIEECLESIRAVLSSGWTGTGPKCAEFEKAWCQQTGAAYSQYVNSATSALHIALRLCDLPKGSKVATTSLTFVSTNAVILYEGHIPVFCDINTQTMSISWQSAIKAVEGGCKAIIWVHYGGNVAPDFYKFLDELAMRNLKVAVIEDCAHAAGAVYDFGRPVGSLPTTISCFSFHSVKNLPTADGGMICLPSKELYERAKKLSWMGISKDTYSRTDLKSEKEIYNWQYSMPELGWKYNGNDIMASIGLVQLKYLERDNAYRLQLYKWYCEELAGVAIDIMEHEKGSSHHLMAIKSDKRDRIMEALRKEGIATGVHYQPNHEFDVFALYYNNDCYNLEVTALRLLSLPNHLCLTHEDVKRVCGIIKSVKL